MYILKIACKIAGIDQQELARRAGVDPATVSRLMSGKRATASYRSMVRIARVFNLSAEELFPVDDLPTPEPAEPTEIPR